ncbi:hypothetical protein HPHPP15B_1497 [Helicobacter pylori Hp P-15b]|uniref:Uncharacterized protein n=1 Tax=Helicobacter pylori Hp P-15 TaxID=992080 RepID=J0QAS6_HELPX|nr:hypothetical protein HPHPP15_1232 [Helicobacter pylori Hp P-15]EJC32660.1 hypothetical protein HPHPP15B_1497 [Helicobacter pylori Hp P-15b]KAF0996859.1 hypothetical protein HPSS1190_08246 [Helicobacter pylori SS1_190]KAF0998977.1 hypothetical protein HPYSS1_04837 [Helicobacter pylori SS1]KAF0999089.1 hypothetical protein HP10700_05110 [Helicobacter pylori 10700]
MGEAFLNASHFTFLHILTKIFSKRGFLSFSNFTFLHILAQNFSHFTF